MASSVETISSEGDDRLSDLVNYLLPSQKEQKERQEEETQKERKRLTRKLTALLLAGHVIQFDSNENGEFMNVRTSKKR